MATQSTVPFNRLISSALSGSTRKRFPLVLVLLLIQFFGKVSGQQPRVAELATRGPSEPRLLPPHLERNSQSSPSSASHPLPDSIRQFKFNSPPSKLAGTEPPSPKETSDEESSFSLSPLVLAVTVDGQVHALRRDTGQWVWTVHDDGGVALNGPGRGSKEERLKRSRAGDSIGGPLVKSASRRKTASSVNSDRLNETGLSPVEEDEGGEPDDETYIIEPSGDGDIYVFSRSNGGLEKLPLSMAELVNLSPFRFPGDNSRLFSASKHTKFVGVDIKTGRLVGVFGSNAGWCEWDEGDELAGGGKKERDEEDCDEDIAKRPEDLLYMARTGQSLLLLCASDLALTLHATEYHLSIYSSQSSAPLQTLSYTTYSSSTFPSAPSTSSPNFPTQATWSQTPDSLYLQPMHDGSLVCFRAGRPGVHWSIDFEAPVVGIFDIAIPTTSTSLGGDEEIHPVMFEQPHPLLVADLPLDFTLLQQEPAATFIGQVNPLTDRNARGELFAMSRDRFPLVPFARLAEVAAELDDGLDLGMKEGTYADYPSEEGAEEPIKRSPLDRRDLIGRHRLRNPPPPSPIHLDSTIDPAPSTSEPLLIEAGPGSPSNEALPTVDPSPSRRSPHYPGSSTLLASMKSSVVRELGEHRQTSKMTLGLLILALAAWFWTKGKGSIFGFGKANVKEEGSRNRRRRRRKAGQQGVSTPASDATDEKEPVLPPKKSFSSSSLSSQIDTSAFNGFRRRSPSTPPTPTSLTFTPASPPRLRQRTRSSSLSLPAPVPSVSPLKALPPLPPSAFTDGSRPSQASSELPPLPTDLATTSLPLSSESTPSPSTSSSPRLDDSPSLPNTSTLQSTADDDGDSDSQALADPSLPRKKNRRRRGGKGKKKGGQAMSKEGSLDDDLPNGEKDLEDLAIGEKETNASVDPQMVGGLAVSETILGKFPLHCHLECCTDSPSIRPQAMDRTEPSSCEENSKVELSPSNDS